MTTIDKLRQTNRVVDNIELLRNICKAMLVYNNSHLHAAVLNEKNINILSKKPPHKLFIQRI